MTDKKKTKNETFAVCPIKETKSETLMMTSSSEDMPGINSAIENKWHLAKCCVPEV